MGILGKHQRLLSAAALGVLAVTLGTAPSFAADAAAGKEKAQVCTACHGDNGISISDDIPNLAGQKGKYLVTQLKNFRAGKRKNALMEPIAEGLSDQDIKDIVAYFAGLPASGGDHAKSAFGADINTGRLAFNADYRKTYLHYHSKNRTDKKQRRHYYANPAAVDAIKAGKPLPDGAHFIVEVYKAKLDAKGEPVFGGDGLYVAGDLVAYTSQKIEKGWGASVPEALRNGDWVYGIYKTDGSHKAFNIAKCYACHKAQASDQYLFLLPQLRAKLGAK